MLNTGVGGLGLGSSGIGCFRQIQGLRTFEVDDLDLCVDDVWLLESVLLRLSGDVWILDPSFPVAHP